MNNTAISANKENLFLKMRVTGNFTRNGCRNAGTRMYITRH